MSLRRTLEKITLKLRGIDLDELEGEMRQMDRAKERREREQRMAEDRAERMVDEMSIEAIRRGG